MATGKEILTIATSQIGYHQGANQNNKYGVWFGMNNQPWCVIFSAAWVYAQAGAVGDVIGRKYKEGGLYSCSQTLDWYRLHDPECITGKPIPGSLVIFDLPNTKYKTDHMGLFVKSEDGYITTIDGNTSATNQSNGGWVQQKTRHLKSLDNIWYIVPRELKEEVDPVEEKRYNTLAEIKKDCPWAVPTVEKLMRKGYLNGDGTGLDLSRDMLRLLVINDRAGCYD